MRGVCFLCEWRVSAQHEANVIDDHLNEISNRTVNGSQNAKSRLIVTCS